MKIKELKNNETGRFTVLLKEVKERTGKNGSFCVLTLKPKDEMEVPARIFKTTREGLLEKVLESSLVNVDIRRSDFNDEVSYVVQSIEPEPNGNVGEYAEESRIPGARMHGWVLKNVRAYLGTRIEGRIVEALYEKYKEQLSVWPAAQKIHHAYRGGLMEHTGTMMLDAIKMAQSVDSRFPIGNGMNELLSESSEELYARILAVLDKENGECSRKAKQLYETLASKNLELLKYSLQLRAWEMFLGQRLLENYPFLDRDIALAGIALRGFRHLGGDIVPFESVGAPALDFLFLRSMCTEEELKSDRIRLLLQAVAVNTAPGDGNVAASTAETFLPNAVAELRIFLEEMKKTGKKFDIPLICAASALHDIGKVKEMDSDALGIGTFSLEGALFAHTYLGLAEVQDACRELAIPLSDADALLHCIASHHGACATGALVEPETPEAKLVSMMDFLDSRIAIYTAASDTLEPGERDDSKRWLVGSVVFKPAEPAEAADASSNEEAASAVS